ncbi:hypothetical protein [Nocardia sp. NPDC050435]|uniref:hypothetical protein n=1 Tax=Nocardia sp. NPDC050435 TaxID=3155040 RepID=UPI003407C66C
MPRPLKRSEYSLEFITSQARKGWVDCVAVARNAMADAWDTLTREPERQSPRLYPLRAELRYGTYAGRTYERYQYKFSDGGRLWYFVDPAPKGSRSAGRVLLERCMPGHPKRNRVVL